MKAYDPISNRHYDSWDDLVADQCTGYVVVIDSSRPNTAPLVYGPWPPTPEGKIEATKARVKLRNRVAKGERPHVVASFVRLMWKDPS